VARELAEMTYEFGQPFVLDTSKYELVALIRAGAKFEKGVLADPVAWPETTLETQNWQ
jgi:hypothetical protein